MVGNLICLFICGKMERKINWLGPQIRYLDGIGREDGNQLPGYL